MNKVLGLIGCGNMGQAMLEGIINAGLFNNDDIILSDKNQELLNNTCNKLGVVAKNSNCEVASMADILVIAVKPHILHIVLTEIKDSIKDSVILISIVAGKTIQSIEDIVGKQTKIVRVMPNTPALLGEGMSAISLNENMTSKDTDIVTDIFNSFGKSEIIEEKLMDVATATSGSSPAYVFMFIEAMADGAVLNGMPRDKAYRMAAQTVLGAAKMVLETGMHPGELKDKVCSPGGTTIEAVKVLEETGLRNAVISAMNECTAKSKRLSKDK